MENFVICLGIIGGILLLVVIFGGKNKLWKKILHFFVEVEEENAEPASAKQKPAKSRHGKDTQPHIEMAVLMEKIDERRRVVDSMGHSTLSNEYFELVFQTRKGEILHLETTRASFKEIPFNQQGSLTYKAGKLVKFKYSGGLISDEYTPAASKPHPDPSL